jgi:hypothetical protein
MPSAIPTKPSLRLSAAHSHLLTGGRWRVGDHGMYIGTRCNGYNARLDNDGAVTQALKTQALDAIVVRVIRHRTSGTLIPI